MRNRLYVAVLFMSVSAMLPEVALGAERFRNSWIWEVPNTVLSQMTIRAQPTALDAKTRSLP